MQNRLEITIVLALLALVVGVPFLFHQDRSGESQAEQKLVIWTPHNAQIREEFARAYNQNRVNRGLEPVDFDWRAGGTSELSRSVISQLDSLAHAGKEDDGFGVDLFWGGGEYDHDVVLAGGVDIQRDGQTVAIPASVPFTIDQALMDAAYPEPTIGGVPLYRQDKRWIGVALSSFGIVYNRDGLHRLGVDEPKVWRDLADPRLSERVALADPNHSGSITAAYEAILRRQGWTDGWWTLRRAFANARSFSINSARVPMDVAAGEAEAGMCIDFYGRYEVGAMPNDGPNGQPRVGYVDPVMDSGWGAVSLTATNADPVSLMRGAPSMDLANDFAKWLLSPEAQLLWQLEKGQEGGPERYELRRQPIRQDVYAKDRTHWTDPEINPFVSATAVPNGTPSYFSVVRGVTRAMAIDNRDLLKEAWQAINQTADDDPRKAQMLEAFDAMPEELAMMWPQAIKDPYQTLNDPTRVGTPEQLLAKEALASFGKQLKTAYPRGLRDAKELAWAQFFKGQYEKVIALSKQSELASTP